MRYSDLTMRYFETAPGAGTLPGAGTGTLLGAGMFRGAAGQRARGTWVQFDIQVSGATVQAARFLAFGCPHTIAVAAWVAEQAVGREVRPGLPEPVEELSRRFAVPIEKRGRLLIIEDAWAAAAGPAVDGGH